jgi:cardiolipin synthase
MDFFQAISNYSYFSNSVLLADLIIRVSLSIRVIMRKRPYGVSLAWLVVILLVPFLGGFFYLLFGENRIPERRIERARVGNNHYQHWLKTLRLRAPVDWQRYNPECQPIHRQAEALVDRKSTRLNSSHNSESRMPSSA